MATSPQGQSRASSTCLFILLLFLCITQVLSAGQLCGNVGTHDAAKTTFYMGNFFFKAPSTFALCADFCKNDYPACKSFRYSYYVDADAQYCEFFGAWLETYFIPDATQPYYYYDVDCGFPIWAITETYISSTTITATLTIPQTTTTATLKSTVLATVTATATATATAMVTSTSVATRTVVSTTTAMATATSVSVRTVTSTTTTTQMQDPPVRTVTSVTVRFSTVTTTSVGRAVTATATATVSVSRTSLSTKTVTGTVTSSRVSTRVSTRTVTSTRTG
ncbi:hypothetical protein CC80DRAFT_556110 [Byssothecium circinans]|uniref:Apple domain-containing protein n=1 Tax=Byssothecium circinans TaxID=147558 RepID=A0A6A5T7W4_9PLEO|nr:hypothetical protein CC80DRAFT_556110 [Byssothecium circinans]